LHENEGILGKKGDLGEIRAWRAPTQAVNSAFFPVYEMDFIEFTTPIMARENY
jgi:hypothetical protein